MSSCVVYGSDGETYGTFVDNAAAMTFATQKANEYIAAQPNSGDYVVKTGTDIASAVINTSSSYTQRGIVLDRTRQTIERYWKCDSMSAP